MLVFSLNTKQDAVIHEDAAKVCPELKKITKEELLYIIVVYDYYSPYHQFDETERKEIGINKFLKGKKNPETKVSVQKAITAYKALQFDQKRETLAVYREKLNALTMEIAEATDSARIQDLMRSSDLFRKTIKELEKSVDEDEKMAEIKGGSTLSFIEIFQQNKDEYFNTWLPTLQRVEDNNKKEELLDD